MDGGVDQSGIRHRARYPGATMTASSRDRGAVNDKKFVCKKCHRAIFKSREGVHKVDPMCTLRAYHLKMADKDWQHIDPRMEADFIAHGIIMARGPYSMDWSRHAG